MFKFSTNSHVDVLYGEQQHNFGYNYTMKFFPVIWLYHRQVTKNNIFTEKKFNVRDRIPLEAGLTRCIDEAVRFGRKLPVDRDEFNLNLKNLGLGGPGLGKGLYPWSLKEDGLFHLDYVNDGAKIEQPDVLVLSPQTDHIFLKEYLSFLGHPSFGACQGWSREIISRLKNI
ncbi:MAG: hypothetical protein WCK29_03360 [archaeon]